MKKKYSIDYAFKQYVLQEDYPRIVNMIEKSIFCYNRMIEDGIPLPDKILDIDTAMNMRCLLLEQHPKEYEEALKINEARFKRVQRLSKNLEYILTHCTDVTFITLTFTDESLKKTTAETRRRYVSRVLKAHKLPYVANIDFGKKNHREHYHAVLGGIFDRSKWSLGHCLSEWVQKDGDNKKTSIPKSYESLTEDELQAKLQSDSKKRLSKYIAKLTNHAIKETAKSGRIIVWRKPKTEIKQEEAPFDLKRDFAIDFEDFEEEDYI